MHHSIRVCTLLVGSLLLLLVAACDDPSNVGIGVGGNLEGGAPVTVELKPTTFERESIVDITSNSSRILAGSVNDPTAGHITATGFIDLSTAIAPSDEFLDGPIESAELRLFPDYVYGDTLETITMGLYDMNEEWPATGVPADTTLPSGSLIREFEVNPTDSVVTVPMPDAWVEANDEVLRDTSDAFADAFNGFRIASVEGSGNAIVGFGASSSEFEVSVNDSPTTFAILKTFSGLDQTDVNLPSDRLLLQDGTGTGLAFSFTLPDSIADAPVNRAAIHLHPDTTTLSTSPPDNPNFVRPQSRQVQLLGVPVDSDSPRALPNVSATTPDSENRLVFGGAPIRSFIQQEVLSNPQLDRFVLRLIPNENTVNGLLLYGLSAPDRYPRIYITVTLSQ